MALPKLNDSPRFKLTVPSTGIEVDYRPFLVKEEKVLLIANESGDEQTIATAILDTIIACIEQPLQPKDFTMFDIEWIFLKIRAKSVGETTEVSIKCESCNADNPVKIDINSIDLPASKQGMIIQLNDTITLEMAYAKFERVLATDCKQFTDSGKMFEMIQLSMHAIQTEDERVLLADEPAAAITDFLDSMTTQQFRMITDWVNDVPALKHTVKFKCETCKSDNEVELQGMQNFF